MLTQLEQKFVFEVYVAQKFFNQKFVTPNDKLFNTHHIEANEQFFWPPSKQLKENKDFEDALESLFKYSKKEFWVQC